MHLVQEIGSYAGFAAVVGLALLSALYFSQARDVKRLRDWAGRAPERAAEQEARIAASAQQQRAAAGGGGAPTTVAPPSPTPGPGAATPAPGQPSALPRPAAASTPILGAASRPRPPWYRRTHWPAPRYIALIVAGILIVGGGITYGVSQLVGGESSSTTTVQSGTNHAGTTKRTHRPPAINPHSITVAVLNGTTVNGLASSVADKVEQAGFNRGNTANAAAQGQQAESVVEYSDGNSTAARAVASKLHISQIEKIDAQTQALAGDAIVTVIVGADRATGTG
jgi:hypothetical protein